MTNTEKPLFSVVTPNFNGVGYLPLCLRSVADQQGISGSVEHWVMDGGSTDGSVVWLEANHPPGYWQSEPDRGMYDAINKGLEICQGSIISYLNGDEQYLPGTLARVEKLFAERPDVDLVFGNALLIKPDGSYAASRRGYPPHWPLIGVSQLYVLSCTMFFRRRILEEGFRFNTAWRAVGDVDFVVSILRAGHRAVHDPQYYSTFTLTGENLGGGAKALQELLDFRRTMPGWVRAAALPLNAARLTLKLLQGGYGSDRGMTYAVYTGASPQKRTVFTINQTNHRWPTS
ncbi:MAG TPA: glycosyltransferase family 2 protein [Kiritimatiellia bacterium]|nr:glycosyltransferase family 2 protein [Kiritimatiellia bacterium]